MQGSATKLLGARRSRRVWRCRRGPMTSPPTAAARRVAVIIDGGLPWDQRGRRRRSLPRAPERHLVWPRCRVRRRATGPPCSEFGSIPCAPRGAPGKPSTGPNASRAASGGSRSLASHKSMSAGRCWRDWRQAPSSDKRRPAREPRRKEGRQVRPPGGHRLSCTALRAADPQERKGRHGGIPGRSTASGA